MTKNAIQRLRTMDCSKLDTHLILPRLTTSAPAG